MQLSEQKSFQSPPETVKRESRFSKSRRQRIPNPRACHHESPRAKCHSSCSWNKQFQSASRSQVLPTTSGRQQYAVLCKLRRTQTVLTFVDHGRQLEDDSLTNWEPVQISKNRSDMIVFPCVRDKSSSRILLHSV